MKYKNVVEGRFLERPNRFIAKVEIGDSTERVHVKNTGRCRELLLPGAGVFLEKSHSPKRSTAYDLVAVRKGDRIINMDSQAPNRAVGEWLREGTLFPGTKLVQPEKTYGNSRFDFYIETEDDRIFLEVKGVTLEEEGVVRFPDAPSDRAVKHVQELMQARRAGYRAVVLFVVQMEGVRFFTPNRDTHPEFADALCRAAEEGVEVFAYDCHVTPGAMRVNRPVLVVLGPSKACGAEFLGEALGEGFGEEKLRFPLVEPSGKIAVKEGKSVENIKEIFRKGSLGAIPNLLLKWYDTNKRVLPWRKDPTPYRVWISEIMLQQTRVEAVKPYFRRFMDAFPDIETLAEADEEHLLKLWEGLGYYNRARNLQKAAIQIMKEHGGKMPDSRKGLLGLCGIGSYTAGAIASIAFGRREPAVDGNVLRVIARFRQDSRLVDDPKVKEAVEQDLREIMPAARPGDFNQALMEIGACVCVPNGAPLCGSCPLAEVCMAHGTGTELDYPQKQKKAPRKIEERTILMVLDNDRMAIRRRNEKGLLAGMYEFPSIDGFCTAEEVAGYLRGKGLCILRVRPLEDAKHIFTHREWHMKGYMVRVDELASKPGKGMPEDWLYIEPWEIREKYPIPSAFGAYKKYLQEYGES
jgi:A/G-specific adenine glycosylase/sugar fermentation stimulation protein